jgi:murein hydrolase activator
MALHPGDALSAARGAMLIGASLPDIYGQAAALSRRIDTLRQTRRALIARRADAARNTAYLAQAHIELDQLLAMKRLEADAAASNYGDLKEKLDNVASQAANLQALLQRIAELRATPASQSVVTVTAEKDGSARLLGRDSLVSPAVGTARQGGVDGVGGASAPGLTYTTEPGAQVVSPADGTILFAGPYHKSGQVLILQMADGYDAVLAGLDRLDVRPEDHVLAGEPVGTMSKSGLQPRLYFELRQNGRGMNPAPFMAVALRKAKRS